MKRLIDFLVVAPLLVLGCLGCSEKQPTPTVPEFEDYRLIDESVERFVLLLLIDDTDAVESAAFRDSYLQKLTDTIRNVQPCGRKVYPPDPAAWCEMQWQLVVIHASDTSSSRLRGPSAVPAFKLQGVVAPGATEIEAVASALLDEVHSHVSSPSAPFLALESAYDALALLKGWTRPVYAEEANLLAALGEFDLSELIVAAARDDESPGQLENYAASSKASWETSPGFVVNSIVLARNDDSNSCTGGIEQYARFNQWSNLLLPMYGIEAWPSRPDCQPMEIFRYPGHDPKYCTGYSPALDESGTAKCRMFVKRPNDGICPPELGWLYPREPVERFEYDSEGTEYCEVSQLTGQALASCQNDINCTDCTPGFCFTKVPALTDYCTNQGQFPFPRITHGADAGGTTGLRWRCEQPEERDY